MSTQLATREQPRILSLLKSENVRAEMLKVCPDVSTMEGLLAKAYTVVSENAYLQKCSPESILRAVKKSAVAGLELNGRDCHIVPYGDQAQFLIDVKGYMKLGMECGLRSIHVDIVCANDNFRRWSEASGGAQFVHTIDDKHPRGPVIGAISVVTNASGTVDFEFMSLEEINAIKARSRARGGPWTTDENEMRKKTVLRRHAKRWPLGSKLAEVWQDDDRLEGAQPAKVKLILPDDVVPGLPPPAEANLLPAPADQDGGNVEEPEADWEAQ